MKKYYCYFNGRIVPLNAAMVSINDIGLLRGYAVFDFIKSYQGKPFLLDQHLKRLENSAKRLKLKLPVPKEAIKKIVPDLLKRNKLKEAGIRIVLTGGVSQDGLNFDVNTPTFFITVSESVVYPANYYKKGAKLITIDFKREIPEVKSNNYVTALSLNHLKKKKDAVEILYRNGRKLLEGTTCNFFVFINEKLITPKSNILIGITRKTVLSLAKKKFILEERELSMDELRNVTEAFITSTTREIMPIVKVDNIKIGSGKVGKNTKYLMEKFKELVNNEVNYDKQRN